MSKRSELGLKVNTPAQTAAFDVASLCVTTAVSRQSPIDRFYEHLAAVVVRTGKPSISNDPVLMRLLLVEVVSVAEYYFRTILNASLGVCEFSRRAAARKVVSIHAVGFYDADSLGLGIYEGLSLSNEDNVKKQTLGVTGLQVKDGSSVAVALREFETVCQLRHAIVHAQGYLWSNNSLEIGLGQPFPAVVAPTKLTFQQVALRASNAVRAYNAFLFEGILSRWIDKVSFPSDWSTDAPKFEALHALFVSERDARADPSILTTARNAYDALKVELGD